MNSETHENDIITRFLEQEAAQIRQDDDSNPDDDEGGSDSDNDVNGSVELLRTTNNNSQNYLDGTTTTGSIVVSMYLRISFLLAILALITVLPSYSSSSDYHHPGRNHDGGASWSHPSNTNTATTLFTKVWKKYMMSNYNSDEDYYFSSSIISRLSPVSSTTTKKDVTAGTKHVDGTSSSKTKKDTETTTTSYLALWSDLLFGGTNKEEFDSSSSNHGQCREKATKKGAAIGDDSDDPFSLLQWFLGFDSLFYYNPHKSMAAFERLSGTTSSTSSSASSSHSISSSSSTEKRSSSSSQTTTTLETKTQEETTTLFQNCPFVEYRTLKRSTGNQTSVLLPLFLDTNTNHSTLWNIKLCPPRSTSNNPQSVMSMTSHDNGFVWSTIMEDIYASTPRLVAVTNIWPCLLLVLYFYVSYLFIGRYHHHEQGVSSRRQQRRQGQRFPPSTNTTTTGSFLGATTVAVNEQRKCTSMYGLRCGLGYVLFRLSLTAAVLKPLHTLDFLILIVWYSWICLLRSLAVMTFKNLDRVITKLVLQGRGGQQPQHQKQQQQEEHEHGLYYNSNNNINISMILKTLQTHVKRAEPLCVGILSLLVVLLLSTMATSMSCIYIFKSCSGGWRMLALLVLDSIGVFVDVMKHIVTYMQGIILEQVYRDRLCDLEAQLMNQSSDCVPVSFEESSLSSSSLVQEKTTTTSRTMKEIEHEIEDVEFMHHWWTTWSQFMTKGFELMSLLITVLHYMNLWNLHGLQFGLIDSILFFHLHWTLSTIRSKISDCQRMTHLKHQIQCSFDNATEEDLTIANHEGDVCCICLGNLYYTKTTNIKRLRGCKHLYHSHCLEKVVARVRSSESVKCPLCRNPMMGETKPKTSSSNTVSQQPQQQTNNSRTDTPRTLNSPTVVERHIAHGRGGGTINNVNGGREGNNNNIAGNNDHDMMIHEDNVSILRFSTDRFVPSWLSLPSFSFEVVRRQAAAPPQAPPVVPPPPRPATDDRRGTNNNNNHHSQPQEQTNNDDTVNAVRDSTTNNPRGGGGLLSMIFGGGGASSSSSQQQSEEEMELALEQLMEMFPQYDRDDLLHELQRRGGSIEHVAERIILGQL